MSGLIFILSAPSGAGKTSLLKKLLPNLKNTSISISHTTREKRTGEIDGVDYHFCNIPDFHKIIKNRGFIEYAKVFQNFYGTSLENIKDTINKNENIILEIDWQGMRQVYEKFAKNQIVSIFIVPPSIKDLEHRLILRKKDNIKTIKYRMNQAKDELSHYNEYDYVVINDNFQDSLNILESIFNAEILKNTKLEIFKNVKL